MPRNVIFDFEIFCIQRFVDKKGKKRTLALIADADIGAAKTNKDISWTDDAGPAAIPADYKNKHGNLIVSWAGVSLNKPDLNPNIEAKSSEPVNG